MGTVTCKVGPIDKSIHPTLRPIYWDGDMSKVWMWLDKNGHWWKSPEYYEDQLAQINRSGRERERAFWFTK